MARLPMTPAEVVATLQERRPRPDICPYSEPRDALENTVCQLWAEVLHIERVGRDDNIFDLGADSFQMLMIGARLTELCAGGVQIGEFFGHPTVAAIVEHLRDPAPASSAVSAGTECP